MANYTELTNDKAALDSITALEKELSKKLGKGVAMVAYSPACYACLEQDASALQKITALEGELAQKLGKSVVLVAYSM